MKIHKIIIIFMVVFCLSVQTNAQDLADKQSQMWGAETLDEGRSDNAKALMNDQDFSENPNFFHSVISMFQDAVLKNERNMASAIATSAQILLIVVVCQFCVSICGERAKSTVLITGVLAIVASCTSDLKTMIGLGRQTVDEIMDYSSLLLPVMVSASTATGSLTGANSVYVLTTVFSNLLIRFCKAILIPAIYAYLVLALTDAAVQQERLKKIRELVGWGVEKGLKTVMYLFVGFLSITGMLTSAADTAALKAAKATISGTVPVVGGIISGAADTFFSSAVVLKNTIGTFGMLAIFATFLIPFVNMGVSYLLFKITAALGGILGSKLCGFLDSISVVLGYLLAMVACCVTVSIISCCYFIRAVHV